MSTKVDDIFTPLSISDLEAGMFNVMGLMQGPRIAVPGVTPEEGGYPAF